MIRAAVHAVVWLFTGEPNSLAVLNGYRIRHGRKPIRAWGE